MPVPAGSSDSGNGCGMAARGNVMLKVPPVGALGWVWMVGVMSAICGYWRCVTKFHSGTPVRGQGRSSANICGVQGKLEMG